MRVVSLSKRRRALGENEVVDEDLSSRVRLRIRSTHSFPSRGGIGLVTNSRYRRRFRRSRRPLASTRSQACMARSNSPLKWTADRRRIGSANPCRSVAERRATPSGICVANRMNATRRLARLWPDASRTDATPPNDVFRSTAAAPTEASRSVAAPLAKASRSLAAPFAEVSRSFAAPPTDAS